MILYLINGYTLLAGVIIIVLVPEVTTTILRYGTRKIMEILFCLSGKEFHNVETLLYQSTEPIKNM